MTSSDYDGVFEHMRIWLRSAQLRVAREHEVGAALWADLEHVPHERRLLLVDNLPRFWRWGLFDRLVAEGSARLETDPGMALPLAQLAERIACRLPEESYGQLCLDFEVSALTIQASACRRLRDFAGARRLVEAAGARFLDSAGDPLVQANLLKVRAALLKDLGHFTQAAFHLGAAAKILRKIGNRSQEGEILLLRSDLVGVVEPRSALAALEQAFELLDFVASPWSELEATHCLIRLLAEVGEAWRAWDILESSRPLYRQFDQAQVRVMRLWLEGQILRGMGELREAEDRCRRALFGLRNLGLSREALRCALDVAAAAWAAGGSADRARAYEVLAMGQAEIVELGFPADIRTRWTCLGVAGFAPALQRYVVDGILRRWSSTRAVPSSHLFFF